MSQGPNVPKATTPPTEDGLARRDVIGVLGLAGAAVLGGGYLATRNVPEHEPHQGPATSRPVNKPYVPGAEHYAGHEERWVTTSCAQCAAGCGVRVRVVEGRAVGIEGNAQNPINRGGIGPRGIAGLQVLYDADRLEGPLAREGGVLVPVTWEVALGRLAEKLAAARAKGPEGVLIMTGRERGFMHDLLARFAAGFGTPNFVDGRPSRSATFAQAMEATLGHYELPAFDWSRADYVLSLGAGALEDSCQLVYLARSAADLRRSRPGKRTTIVHASPAFDLSSNAADEWLRTRPGANAALALGIAHVLVRDNLYDHRFATEQATGFEAFSKWLLAGFSPAGVAHEVGLPARTIERIAHALADRRPSFVYADERSFSYSNGWETALAVLSLNALLGAIGPVLRMEASPPYAEWPATQMDDVARAGVAKPRADGAGTPAFPRARSVHETLPEAFAATPPEVVLLDSANPVYARKAPARWREMLARAGFVVSFSPFRDDTVDAVAHLVLPELTYLERWDDAASAPGVGVPVAGVRKPVVDPLFDARHTGDVVIDVARRLGGTIAKSFPWRTAREALDARLVGLHRAQRGTIVESKESAFFARLYEEGFWTDPDTAPLPLPPFVFHAAYAEARFEGDEQSFPLKLIAYRPLGYAEGSGANLPWLRQLRSRPGTPRVPQTLMSIHPSALPGVKTGDLLDVSSPYGTAVVVARVDPRMAPDAVAIPMGEGHEAFGRWAKGRGVNVMSLLAPGAAPVTGANSTCTTRVRVARKEQRA